MFQKRILEKYIAKLDKSILDEKYKIFCSIFANPEKQENIRNSKEEQYQEGFLRDLFVSVLGYTINPEPNYNLITEQKNTSTNKDNRKADGAIIFDNNIKAVIELKGTDTTDLNKIESQAFLYKEHNLNCKYVVISNFERLRFYIENAIEYKEFNLFNLSKQDFEVLYLCLEVNQIKNDIPFLVKNETVSEEKEITDNFYNDYSQFKRKLFEDICKNNLENRNEEIGVRNERLVSGVELDKLLLFKKTQKLLDRILFVFFCEDRGLLPPNSINTIIQQWEQLKDLDAYQPLYSRFQNYFNRINEGYKSPKNPSENIFAYNGGLFKLDEILDKIKIGDEVLEIYTKRLSNYDFESQISVDILGHIFEHSLTEIEEIQNQLEAEKSGLVAEKTDVGKRKKDGVFYTPAYITKYIVENTIGKLCNDKKEELGIKDSAFSKQKKTSKEKDELLKKLDSYKDWLLSLKILDPACGSGAFLNAALKQLKTEHTLIDYYRAKIYGDSLIFQDVENVILEKNIFGVDINEESVEIAKLSLWLHTAQKDRKLTTLNNNIKCGNSLIDDVEIAGDKAFNWEKEFPEVFANGGFDVVIGNPPYVRVQQLDYKTIDELKRKYKTALKRIDISLCFIEKSKELINDNGCVSFITSNQFLTTEYGQSIRHFLLNEFFLTECVDFGDLPIFADAMTYVSIFKFSKQRKESFNYTNIKEIDSAKQGLYSNFNEIKLSELNDSNWNLASNSLKAINSKIEKNSIKIEEIGNAWYGIVSGADDVFIFDKEKYEKSDIEKDIFLPLMRAQNCSKYYCSKAEKYILYPYKIDNGNTILLSEIELSQKFPKAYNYLLTNKEILESRKDSRSTFKGRKDWYCLTRFGQLDVFNKNKIFTPGEVKDHKFCFNSSLSGYSGARVFAIVIDEKNYDLKYVLCLLNSDLMKSYLQSFSSLKAGGYYSYSSNILNRVPIKNISLFEQQPFINLADKMLSLNADLQKSTGRFIKRVKENLNPAKISSALENFYTMEFSDFVKELTKQKVKLSLKQQDEWEEYFAEYKENCVILQEQINTTDTEINQLVYKLYDLTEEEIAIVDSTGK